MKILFIYSEFYMTKQGLPDPKKPLFHPWQKQFGISYISALLKKYGHKTELLVLTRETKKHVLDSRIGQFRAKLICLTAVFREYEFIFKTAQYIKLHYPDIYLLIGGAHVTLNPDVAVKGPFDAICIGEGEYPTLELVTQLEKNKNPSGVENLWIRHGQQIEKNSTRPFIDNLDDLPFPDMRMWQKWIKYRENQQVILAGRGCPFHCTFCCNHALKKIAKGNYVRLRSPDSLLKEIKQVTEHYPKTKMIYFEVESIDLNGNFVSELCVKLERFNKRLKKPLAFGANLRIVPDRDYGPLFMNLKRANFKFIHIGFESGSQRIREKILNRYYSNQNIMRVVRLAKKHNLEVALNIMIGIPDETLSDLKKTFEYVKKIQPSRMQISYYAPYPGTKLYDLCKKRGLLREECDAKMERHELFLKMPERLKKEAEKELNFFLCEFYSKKKGAREP